MVSSTEDNVLIKVFWPEKGYGAKIDRRISQQVADMVRLDERYV